VLDGTSMADGIRRGTTHLVHTRGDGFTRDEAIDDLKRKFQERKAEHARLPRPGRGAPFEIKFAPTDQIELYREIAEQWHPVEAAQRISLGPSEYTPRPPPMSGVRRR
jgi:hypothetical protein